MPQRKINREVLWVLQSIAQRAGQVSSERLLEEETEQLGGRSKEKRSCETPRLAEH